MEKQRLFQDRQEVQAEDFNKLQDFARQSIDHVVADGINDARRYIGMNVSQASTTEIKVGTGRLYEKGEVYSSEIQVQRDLVNELPVANKRFVSIVVFPEVINTQAEPRDFLVDVDTGETEPQTVALVEWRRAQIDFASGSESIEPKAPAVPTGALRVADVLLDPTGVVSITQTATNQLGGLQKATSRLNDLRAWRHSVNEEVSTLRSNFSDVRGELGSKAGKQEVMNLYNNLLSLRSVLGLPTGVSNMSKDDFKTDINTTLDGTFSDAAFHREGGALHFPDGGNVTTELALFDRSDSRVHVDANGQMTPSRAERVVMQVDSEPTDDLATDSFPIVTTETRAITRNKTVTKTGTRKGDIETILIEDNRDNARAPFWIFTQLNFDDTLPQPPEDGDIEERTTRSAQNVKKNMEIARDRDNLRIIKTEYEQEEFTFQEEVPVQEEVQREVTNSVSGAHLGQTMLSPSTMWLSAIGVNVTQMGDRPTQLSNEVTVQVTGLKGDGTPNIHDIRAESSIPFDEITTQKEVKFPIGKMKVEAGEGIAVFISGGGYRVGTVDDDDMFQGEVLYLDSNQEWRSPSAAEGKSLALTVYSSRFDRVRTTVRLGDVSLSAGVTDLEIATEIAKPEGTNVKFEYQYDGQWYPLTDAKKLVRNKPTTVPMRVTLVGTKTMQPMVKLGPDRIKAERAGTSMVHYSAKRQLPSPSSELFVDAEVRAFNGTEESLNVTLLDADNGNAPISPSSQEDINVQTVKRADGTETDMVKKRVRFTFTPTGLQNYYVRSEGTTTTTASRPFYMVERVDSAV